MPSATFPRRTPGRTPFRLSPRVAAGAATVALALTTGLVGLTLAPAGAADGSGGPAASERRAVTVQDGVVVTPGDFTGYGFDQCQAPDQKKMNTWWRTSPYSAVGIYISGKSRACRYQDHLDADWVMKQATKGWRLLPITLGPQASCQPRFPRYSDDELIKSRPGKKKDYHAALKQGRAEALSTVADAKALGIAAGSTLWYDLEGFNLDNTNCRESALSFLSGWTQKLHRLDYVSGVYSSAGSGIRALDDARVERPNRFTLPDAIWIARWDGKADTSTHYIRDDGWRPGGRMKQYLGGHDETWGGVRINIDSNFIDLGKGTTARPEPKPCNGTRINFPDYELLRPPRTKKNGTVVKPDTRLVSAAQCLLKQQGYFDGEITGSYGGRMSKATRAWQADHGYAEKDLWSRQHWMTLLATGPKTTLKRGASGVAVRRLQRALNATSVNRKVAISGVFGEGLEPAVKSWQSSIGHDASGVVNARTWRAVLAGKRS